MKQMLKDTLILFIITLIAGLALGAVNEFTKEPIRLQEEKKKAKAYAAVFEDAVSFEDEADFEAAAMEDVLAWWKFTYELLNGVDTAEKDTLAALEGADYSDEEIEMFASAYDGEGNLLGYVITVTTHAGFGGDITFSMGIRLDGTMNGISITSISETAGLGMRASEVLVPQFAGKSTDIKFTVTKTGATYPAEIDAISGATITSDALTDGVNAGVAYFQYRMFLLKNGVEPFTATEGGAGK